jgi:hypothetical protein
MSDATKLEPIKDIEEWPDDTVWWHYGYYKEQALRDPFWQDRVDEMQAELERRKRENVTVS